MDASEYLIWRARRGSKIGRKAAWIKGFNAFNCADTDKDTDKSESNPLCGD